MPVGAIPNHSPLWVPAISARTAARPGAPMISWTVILMSGNAALRPRISGSIPSRPGAWPGASGMSCQSGATA